jgi:serine/threonine-protein kinase
MDSYYGQSVYGGTVAAPIWHSFMVKAVAGMPVEGFPGPPVQARGTIPNVVGLRSEEAQQVLTGAEFTPLVKKVESSAPENAVLEQSPPGGATAPLGSAVTLTVSNGTGKGKGDGGETNPRVYVPDVTGMAEQDAVEAIEGSGLVPAVRYEDVTDPKRQGIVLTQSPAVGERVPSGSTVAIVVGQHKAGPNRRP